MKVQTSLLDFSLKQLLEKADKNGVIKLFNGTTTQRFTIIAKGIGTITVKDENDRLKCIGIRPKTDGKGVPNEKRL